MGITFLIDPKAATCLWSMAWATPVLKERDLGDRPDRNMHTSFVWVVDE